MSSRRFGASGRAPHQQRGLLLVALALLISACGPLADLSGGELAGEVDSDDEPAAESPLIPTERTVRLPPPVEGLPPAVPANRASLITDLADLVEQFVVKAPEVTWGIMVTDAYGREVYSIDPDAPVLPASTLKVVTAAGALVTFGAQAGLPTHLEATAAPRAGRLVGDLVLVGGGDPALATEQFSRWVYPIRPVTRIEDLADAVVDAGIGIVDGDIIGFAPGSHGPPLAQGWPQRYLSEFDARYAAGLTVDAGLMTVITWPDELETDSQHDANDVGGPALGLPPREGEPSQDSSALEDGSRLLVEPLDITVEHAVDPVAQAAVEFLRVLTERGVEVTGTARSGLAPVTSVRLATLEGTAIRDLVQFALERSDNHMADGLFRAVGMTWTGESSWTGGAHAAREVMRLLDVDPDGAIFADGSGLSRDDRLTARQLVDVDRVMTSGPLGGEWQSAMAVMGRTGTLRQRLVGTIADGRFFGKTGSLRDAMSISGTVMAAPGPRGPTMPEQRLEEFDDGGESRVAGEGVATEREGERFHVAVIANDVVGADRIVARRLMDELILILAAHVEQCEVDRLPPQPADDMQIGELVIAC
ncbi:MAG: D-alanyl-D-alanine carboxypeptidase [Nitriliruptoraceae bacterium]